MRKRVTGSPSAEGRQEGEWLDLEQIAEVEITSEDPDFPIEHALLPSPGGGWRASAPGRQTIRLLFPDPRPIQVIHLDFEEAGIERTQEFQLSWAPAADQLPVEILRQQWNFSPNGATRQTEELRVDLARVAVLELTITPDIGGGEAQATLARMRLA